MRQMVLMALGVLLVGCSGGSGGAETVTPSAPLPSPSALSSASPSAPASFEPAPQGESEEEAAIRAGLVEFWRVYEMYAADPQDFSNTGELNTVATGDGLEGALALLGQLRASGRSEQGGLRFSKLAIGKPEEGVLGNAAKITYCADTTALKILDDSGKIVDRNTYYFDEKMTMVETPSSGVWKVAEWSNEVRDRPC